MKIPAANRTAAFSRRDLIVVIVMAAGLVVLMASGFSRGTARADRVYCINALKCIGSAYRLWANDNAGQFPEQVSVTNGGVKEWVSGPNAAASCWAVFAAMSSELGQASAILVCPSDERKSVTSFGSLSNNLAISYFAATEVNAAMPRAILGGDRNLGPGTLPTDDYGYSSEDGKGGKVLITKSVTWTRKIHSRGKPSGAGNILLVDGSAHQTYSGDFRQSWLSNALENVRLQSKSTTNVIGLRLLFP